MERIIYKIHEDIVQSASSANLGRELTEKELKRLIYVLMEGESFFDAIYGQLVEASREAMKNEGWKEWDKMYKNVPFEEIYNTKN